MRAASRSVSGRAQDKAAACLADRHHRRPRRDDLAGLGKAREDDAGTGRHDRGGVSLEAGGADPRIGGEQCCARALQAGAGDPALAHQRLGALELGGGALALGTGAGEVRGNAGYVKCGEQLTGLDAVAFVDRHPRDPAGAGESQLGFAAQRDGADGGDAASRRFTPDGGDADQRRCGNRRSVGRALAAAGQRPTQR